jgi:hypothetical protein
LPSSILAVVKADIKDSKITIPIDEVEYTYYGDSTGSSEPDQYYAKLGAYFPPAANRGYGFMMN